MIDEALNEADDITTDIIVRPLTSKKSGKSKSTKRVKS